MKLTPEREKEIRNWVVQARKLGKQNEVHEALLAEIDALREELTYAKELHALICPEGYHKNLEDSAKADLILKLSSPTNCCCSLESSRNEKNAYLKGYEQGLKDR